MSKITLIQQTLCQRTARNVMGTGEVSDVIQVGDGLFARRLANGNCVRCDTFLDGALECKVCHLVYGDNHGRKR